MLVPELFNLLLVGFLFFLIFGLLALNYFKGAFYACHTFGDLERFGSLDYSLKPNKVSPLCIDPATGCAVLYKSLIGL